jgi:hypothetical protein
VIRLVVALAIVVVAAAASFVVRRRRAVDAPTQPEYEAPTQLDRADFPEATGEWLLVVFTSASCHSCADVARKAKAAASRSVSVVDVEHGASPELHRRYRIDAVPTTVIADADGVVRRSFLGPVSATDLWVAVAKVRDPELAVQPCQGHGAAHDAAHDHDHGHDSPG